MRREMMPFYAAMLGVMVLSSAGYAAPTADAGSHINSLAASGGSYNVLDYYSDAYAFAASDIGGSSEDEDDGLGASRIASSSVTGANAMGLAGLHTVDALAHAGPSGGAAGGYGSAMQAMYFGVTTGGTFTFDALYSMNQSLLTQLLGESAGASTTVAMRLIKNGTVIDEDSEELSNSLSDGNANDYLSSGQLEVDGVFASGDTGVLLIMADAEALASVIPVPGALLLAGIGTVLVGWTRRRKAV